VLFTAGSEREQVNITHLKKLHRLQHLFPAAHATYLYRMREEGVRPHVIYDIGANVLHWMHAAKRVWPNALYFAFEAMHEVASLYAEEHVPYCLGVLGNHDGKKVRFFVSPEHPSGNSYYKENSEVNGGADSYFLEANARTLPTVTLDTAVREKGWPAPDLIKLDIQGAEMDVLKGARNCLSRCRDLIVELQKVEYNKGAPLREEVIAYIESIGFQLKIGPFCETRYDGDYHFTAVRTASS
jgi:FkbM family methyltransferase